jgi:hypothetical protein
MLIFRVIPGLGVGPICFGFSREEVKQTLATEPIAVLPRGSEGHEKQAFYYNASFTLEYSDNNSTVEWIGVSRNDQFMVTYKDIDLFGTEAEVLISLISKEASFDKNDPLLGYSYIFPELGLAFWRPSTPEKFGGDEENVEYTEYLEEDRRKANFFQTVSLGIKDYYTNNPTG